MYYIKSVSPLIASILLIVIAVILVVAVLTWGKDFTSESLNETKDVFITSSLTGFVTVQHIHGNYITIANKHRTEDVNIISYQIVPSVDNQLSEYLNERIYILNQPIYLSSNSISSFRINCFPERNFFINLITDDNKSIRINVVNNNHISEYEYLGCYTVFREDFLNEQAVIDNGFINLIDSNFEKGFAKFNGSTSRMTLPNLLKHFDGDFAIRLKFRVNTIGDQVILYFADNTQQKIGFSIRPDQNVFGWTRNASIARVHNINILETEKWYDCIFTRIGSNNFGYVNGVTNTGSGNLWSGKTDLNIGYISSRGISTLQFDGDIDLLEIYDRSLTPEEVSALYENI